MRSERSTSSSSSLFNVGSTRRGRTCGVCATRGPRGTDEGFCEIRQLMEALGGETCGQVHSIPRLRSTSEEKQRSRIASTAFSRPRETTVNRDEPKTMSNFLLNAHSGLRYLILLGGVLTVLYATYGVVLGRAYDKTIRILASSFVGILTSADPSRGRFVTLRPVLVQR